MSTNKKLSAPLLYYGRVIGLIPFRLGEDQSDLEFSIIGVVYATVLAIAYSIVFVLAMNSRFTASFPLETPLLVISDEIEIVLIYSLSIATWLTFAYKQKHIIRMVRDFSKIQEIAWEYFGIQTDYERIIRDITIHAMWTNGIFAIFIILNYTLLFPVTEYNYSFWVLFSLSLVMPYNAILLFLASMTAIRRKFRRLNAKLTERGKQINSSTSINDFAYVHGLLCDLAESVSDFFSHLILLIVMRHVIQCVARIYVSFIILKNSEYTDVTLSTTCAVFFDVIVCILQEYFIGSIVDGTVKEARNTGNVLHEMVNKQRPLRQRAQVYALSIQLLRRRLELTAYGLFKYDMTLISKVIGTAATYIIIMMQLENFNPNVPSAQ